MAFLLQDFLDGKAFYCFLPFLLLLSCSSLLGWRGKDDSFKKYIVLFVSLVFHMFSLGQRKRSYLKEKWNFTKAQLKLLVTFLSFLVSTHFIRFSTSESSPRYLDVCVVRAHFFFY